MRPAPKGSCEYRIDQKLGLALVRVSGAVSGARIARCAEALQSDPAWSFTYAAIWDERGITSLDVTPQDLEAMVSAQAKGQVGPDIVITVREDHEALLQLYAWRVRARGRPATVCRSLDEALAILELDELPPHLDELLHPADSTRSGKNRPTPGSRSL